MQRVQLSSASETTFTVGKYYKVQAIRPDGKARIVADDGREFDYVMPEKPGNTLWKVIEVTHYVTADISNGDLTKGFTYPILEKCQKHYRVIGDHGIPCRLNKKHIVPTENEQEIKCITALMDFYSNTNGTMVLLKDNIYNVLHEAEKKVCVRDDLGKELWVSKQFFKEYCTDYKEEEEEEPPTGKTVTALENCHGYKNDEILLLKHCSYQVLKEDETNVQVKNELGKALWCSKSRFKEYQEEEGQDIAKAHCEGWDTLQYAKLSMPAYATTKQQDIAFNNYLNKQGAITMKERTTNALKAAATPLKHYMVLRTVELMLAAALLGLNTTKLEKVIRLVAKKGFGVIITAVMKVSDVVISNLVTGVNAVMDAVEEEGDT